MIGLNEYLALVTALANRNAQRALDTGLKLLQGWGVTAKGQHRRADIVVHGRERVIELWCDAGLTPEVRSMIHALLSIALDRAYQVSVNRQLSERLELVSSAAFEGTFAHCDGQIIDANASLAQMLRCEPEELLGDWVLRHCVAPEDLAMVLAHLASGTEEQLTITIIRKDGTRFRAEFQTKQCTLGTRPVLVGAVRDISEHERTVELLRESETRLSELANAAFDVTVLSRNGVIVDVHGAVEQVLGCSREAAIGRPVFEFVGAGALEETRRVIEDQVPLSYRSAARGLSGPEFPVGVVAVNSTLNGEPVRVSGIQDLREPQRLEQERRDLEHQLEQSQRLDSLGVLAGGIAHDFNNLLVGVLGNADLLLYEVTDLSQRESLQAIVSAGEKAAELTAQLLAYAGRAELSASTSVNLREFFGELCVLLSASMSKKAIVSIDVDPDAVVLADPTRLTQVLMNVLTNASDALGDDSGTIDVRAKRVRDPDVRWERSFGATVGPGDWVQVEVRDSGCGMDRPTLERAFEPFFTTKKKGHGLGLAACLGIVRSHGGAVHVDSIPCSGTCVSFLLPASDPDAASLVERATDSAMPCRVLVVDDEPIVRLQLRRCLEPRGYHVTEASNGRAGLDALTLSSVDVVILDRTMPELDGAQVLGQMSERGLTTPVVLASGYLDADTDHGLSSTLVRARLRKPYHLRDLLAAIETARSSPASAVAAMPVAGQVGVSDVDTS